MKANNQNLKPDTHRKHENHQPTHNSITKSKVTNENSIRQTKQLSNYQPKFSQTLGGVSRLTQRKASGPAISIAEPTFSLSKFKASGLNTGNTSNTNSATAFKEIQNQVLNTTINYSGRGSSTPAIDQIKTHLTTPKTHASLGSSSTTAPKSSRISNQQYLSEKSLD